MPTPNDGRTKLDFSGAAAKKAALSDTLQHPMTIVPVAAGTVVATGLAMFSIVSVPVAIGIASGAIITGGVNFLCRFFGGGDALMQKHYDMLSQEFERIREEKTAKLAADLKRLKCKQGQLQVQQLEAKFNNLVEVFDRVLSKGELTYCRFVSTAQQCFKAGLANLDNVVVILTNIDDIDPDGTRERIAELEGNDRRRPADDKTLAALQGTLQVFEDAQNEVADLLATNEEALTTMDQAGAAAVRVKDNSATQTTAESMADSLDLLKRIIERANKRKSSVLTLDSDTEQK